MQPYWQSDNGETRLTIYQGDALNYMRQMPDESVDFIFTDPPYGHNNNNNGDLISRWEAALGIRAVSPDEFRPIPNDSPAEANELFRKALLEFRRLLKPGACLCCCCSGGGPDPHFARWSLWIDEVLSFKQMVVWDKGPMGMGWHYRRSYEVILVAQKPGAACRWYDTTNRVENIIRPGFRGIRKIIPSRDEHPTEKPWQLAAWFISLHTRPGDIVLDPFMGSGSTLFAAQHLGRSAIGIDISDDYCAMAQRRLEREHAQMRLPVGDER